MSDQSDSTDWSSSSSSDSDDLDDTGQSATASRGGSLLMRPATPDHKLEGTFTSFRTTFDLFDPSEDKISVAQLGMALQRSGALDGIALDLGNKGTAGVASFKMASPNSPTSGVRSHLLWPIAASRCGQSGQLTFDGFLKVMMEDDYALYITSAAQGAWPRDRFGKTRICLPELLYHAAVFERLGSHSECLKAIKRRLAEQGRKFQKSGVPMGVMKPPFIGQAVERSKLPPGLLPSKGGLSAQLCQWAMQAWSTELELLAPDLVLPCTQRCDGKRDFGSCCCTAAELELSVRRWEEGLSRDHPTVLLADLQCEAVLGRRSHVLSSWEAFKLFDLDMSGAIDQQEVTTMLGALGKKVSPEEVEQMVLEVDEDADGEVSFPELMQFPGMMSSSNGIGDFKALFAIMNDEPVDFGALQGDATLDPDEMAQLLKMCKVPASSEQLHELCCEVGGDDALVTLAEFICMLACQDGETSKLVRKVVQKANSWRRAFEILDSSENGKITNTELEHFVAKVGQSGSELKLLDHPIDFGEFVEMVGGGNEAMQELLAELIEFWSVFDLNEQGDTCETEAVAVLVRLGCTAQMANKLVRSTNADSEDVGDDDVTFAESVQLLCSETAVLARKQFNGLRQLFSEIDCDKRGYVTLGQLHDLLAQLYSPAEPPLAMEMQLDKRIKAMGMQASGSVPALIFSDFVQIMGLEGKLSHEMEVHLWCNPDSCRFKQEEVEELTFLCIENPRGRRSLKKGEALHSLLVDESRMSIPHYFRDLTLEGVKWLYINHMDLLQLAPDALVFQPLSTANLVYLVVQGSAQMTMAPHAPTPLSTWAMVRCMLDNTAHGLRTAMRNGFQLERAWRQERMNSGVEDGPLAVPDSISALIASLTEVGEDIARCSKLCGASVTHDLADILLLQEPYNRCKQLFLLLERTQVAADKCLSHYTHRLVLARLSGESWRLCSQLVCFVNLSRQLTSATSTGIKSLTKMLHEADSRRQTGFDPKDSAPAEDTEQAAGEDATTLARTHSAFWATQKWTAFHTTKMKQQGDSYFRSLPCKHLVMEQGAYFGDRSLLDKRVPDENGFNTGPDESQHRLGCRAGPAGVWLLVVEAKGWQTAQHINALRLLETSSFFSGMDLHQKRSLVRTMTERTYAVGEMIARAGDESKMLSVVMEGEVKVNQRSSGMPLEMAILSAGDLLDEVQADSRGVLRHSADLLAVTSTVRLFQIPRVEVEPWLTKRPQTCSYKSVHTSRAAARKSRSDYLTAVSMQVSNTGSRMAAYPNPPNTARPRMRSNPGTSSVRWLEPADRPTAVQKWYHKTAAVPERIWPSELTERSPRQFRPEQDPLRVPGRKSLYSQSAKRNFAGNKSDVPEDVYTHSGWHGDGKFTSSGQMATIESQPFKPCVVELEPEEEEVKEVPSARGVGRVVMTSRKMHEVQFNRSGISHRLPTLHKIESKLHQAMRWAAATFAEESKMPVPPGVKTPLW